MNAQICIKVGFCSSWVLSQWGFVLVGFCTVGFCPSGVLSQWGFVLHSTETLAQLQQGSLFVQMLHYVPVNSYDHVGTVT